MEIYTDGDFSRKNGEVMARDLDPTVAPNIVQMGPRAGKRRKSSASSSEFQYGAGSLCLDFAGTLDGRGDGEIDLLSSPDRLEEWLRGPELPLPVGGLTDEDLVAAHALRDAIEKVARARIAGEDAASVDVRCINSFATSPTPIFLLQSGARSRVAVGEPGIDATLSVIARDAVHLLTGSDAHRLRQCARVGCSTLFFDRSPSGRRRWCSMKGCGEMVASASYRKRRTAEATQ
jgi:predicted RNA-binding Zn ribbon-like protein